MKTEFELRGEYIELIKLLKVTGVCATGGQAKAAVEENSVRVDGTVETRKKCKIRKGQKIEYLENEIIVK